MSAVVDAKMMTVVGAIKQSIEQAAGPGVSVNGHPNPFFLNVNGALDLKHAATLVIQRVEEYEAALKAKAEALVKKIEDELKAEYVALKNKLEGEEKLATAAAGEIPMVKTAAEAQVAIK